LFVSSKERDNYDKQSNR